MKVFLVGEKSPWDCPIEASELWDDHKSVLHGHKQVSILLKRGNRSVFKSIRRIDVERTFTQAILAAHGDTIPPPPRVPTLPSAGVQDTEPPNSSCERPSFASGR